MTISLESVGQAKPAIPSNPTPEHPIDPLNSALQVEQIELPVDRHQVVCSLQYSGGFRPPPQPGFQETPLLRVFADGKVVTGGSSPKARIVEMQLSDSELQSLLHDILVEQKFAQIQAADIDLAIQQTGQRIMVMDAPETEIVISTRQETHQVKQYATQFLVKQFPQIELAQRLAKVENRLRQVYAIAQIGGSDAVAKLVDSVNEAAKQQGILQQFTAQDLTWANVDSRSSLSAMFQKFVPDSTGRESVINVLAKTGPNGDWQVNFHGPTPIEVR